MAVGLSPAGTATELPGSDPLEGGDDVQEPEAGTEESRGPDTTEQGEQQPPAFREHVSELWEGLSEEERKDFLSSDFVKQITRDLRRQDFDDLNRRYQDQRNRLLDLHSRLEGLPQRFQEEAGAILTKAAQAIGMSDEQFGQALERYNTYAWVGTIPRFEEAIRRSVPFKDTSPAEWDFTQPSDLLLYRGAEGLRALLRSWEESLNAAYKKGLQEAETKALEKAKPLLEAERERGRAEARARIAPRQPGGGTAEPSVNVRSTTELAKALAAGRITEEEFRKHWPAAYERATGGL